MAISGAAVSPNMGSSTIRPLAFTLAFLNIRLGYWLRNPKFVARIDFGVIIELPWKAIADQGLCVNKAFERAKADGSPVPCSPGPHCAAGEINYGRDEKGILLYFKSSLSGDEDDYLLDYKRRHPAFPHETTGDQFFGEEQFEAYRALGFHIVEKFFTKEAPFAVVPRAEETEDEARGRFRRQILEALRSPKAVGPGSGSIRSIIAGLVSRKWRG
jgi:hypothetical protein